jgi:hypothetical protein
MGGGGQQYFLPHVHERRAQTQGYRRFSAGTYD